MPQIKDKISKKYGLSLGVTPVEFDVDEAVAKGAAKAGEIKIITGRINSGETIEDVAEETGKTPEEILLDTKTVLKKVATKSYGIRVLKNGEPLVRNLIVKQTPVPIEDSQTFGTAGPNADEIDLIVYVNNESEADASLNMSQELGQAVFQLDGNLPAKTPIEITFKLDDEGSLTLIGLDKTYGKTITANFKAEGIMTEEQLKEASRKLRDLTTE